MKIAKLINTKSKYSNYNAEEIIFENQRHFDNWYNKVTSKGLKIIGIFDLALEIECQKSLTNSHLLEVAKIEFSNDELKYLSDTKNYAFTNDANGSAIFYKVNGYETHMIQLTMNNKLVKYNDTKEKQIPFYNDKKITAYIETLTNI